MYLKMALNLLCSVSETFSVAAEVQPGWNPSEWNPKLHQQHLQNHKQIVRIFYAKEWGKDGERCQELWPPFLALATAINPFLQPDNGFNPGGEEQHRRRHGLPHHWEEGLSRTEKALNLCVFLSFRCIAFLIISRVAFIWFPYSGYLPLVQKEHKFWHSFLGKKTHRIRFRRQCLSLFGPLKQNSTDWVVHK